MNTHTESDPPINPDARSRQRDALRDQAVDLIRRKTDVSPDVAIILGSGLGGLADKIDEPTKIDYGDLAGFAKSTAGGHRGQLLLGQLAGVPIVAMAGRFHRYEGHSNAAVEFPVHVMQRLGAKRLIVSNAAGGVNPKLSVGDIVIIRDHINLMGGGGNYRHGAWHYSPLRSGEVYDATMSALARRTGVDHGFDAIEGTYLATLGPTYETRSEYRMMRRMGADVAGMSTVPEVLAATSVGMKVLGLSMVANVANPDQPITTSHAEVLQAGRAAAGKMEAIVRAVLRTR
jgi:purine-nucleoside phosphorylase